MDTKAVVIPGEAPESDDEGTCEIPIGFTFKYIRNTSGKIISGEATESDDDGASWSSASAAIDATTCPPYVDMKPSNSKKNFIKYNSLLHKKLYECNESLRSSVIKLTKGTIANGVQELININKQLVKSELIVQEAASQLRNASVRWNEASSGLFHIIDVNFLNTIKT